MNYTSIYIYIQGLDGWVRYREDRLLVLSPDIHNAIAMLDAATGEDGEADIAGIGDKLASLDSATYTLG